MHRSGSSLVAKIFDEIGFWIGGDRMGPDGANPDGFYESWNVVRMNTHILMNSKGDWNRPPKIPVEKGDFDKQIKETIKNNVNDFCALKDNRFAFTLPAWEKHLEDFKLVIVDRDKDAVIKSLDRTHKMLFQESIRNDEYYGWLYDEHYKRLNKYAKKYPTLRVKYENFFKEPGKEFEKIINLYIEEIFKLTFI